MKIELTQEQNTVVRYAIETGRVLDQEQAGREAMALRVERERRRAELLASLDAAEASLTRSENIVLGRDAARVLTEDVKREGRERVAARNTVSR
jgi:hypothetical protein